EEASFKENELEEIDAELKMLNNSEEIKHALSKVYFELRESESPIVHQLKTLSNLLQGFSSFHPQLPELTLRLQSAQLEVQDIAGDIDSISNHINYSPEKIEQLNDRLALGHKLLKKHGVKTTVELLGIQKQFEEKLRAVLNIEDEIRNKEKIVAETRHALSVQAKKISDARHKQAKPLDEKINKLLAQVGMPNAKIRVEVKDEIELNSFGMNSIEFLF